MGRWDSLKALWDRACSEGVCVCYELSSEEHADLSGWFHEDPRETGPQIGIMRSQCPGAIDEPERGDFEVDDLITLAHEYGHFRSWKDWTEGKNAGWGEYRDARELFKVSPLGLTERQKKAILAEEEQAWARGVVTLKWSRF